MLACKFLCEDRRSLYGYEYPWRDGETRCFPGSPILCMYGYHSSPTWLDAFQYIYHTQAALFDVSTPVSRDETKMVSRTATCVLALDVTRQLQLWNLDCVRNALRDIPNASHLDSFLDDGYAFLDGRQSRQKLNGLIAFLYHARSSVYSGNPLFFASLAVKTALRVGAEDSLAVGTEIHNTRSYLCDMASMRTVPHYAWDSARLDFYLDPLFAEARLAWTDARKVQ